MKGQLACDISRFFPAENCTFLDAALTVAASTMRPLASCILRRISFVRANAAEARGEPGA